ncbi:unnamed protein product [Merluccius merluccius]
MTRVFSSVRPPCGPGLVPTVTRRAVRRFEEDAITSTLPSPAPWEWKSFLAELPAGISGDCRLVPVTYWHRRLRAPATHSRPAQEEKGLQRADRSGGSCRRAAVTVGGVW